MISKFKLIRNVGIFDSVEGKQDSLLKKLTLIYAENARGKTTLASILRSLQSGDNTPIMERIRIGSSHYDPHIIIESIGREKPIRFQNKSWTDKIPNIIIFDDIFIDQNVFSGLKVTAGHRQNLHEIIIGHQGVDLARKLEELADKINTHNTELKKKADLIPIEARLDMSVDDFCDLKEISDIDEAINKEERRYLAFRNAEEVQKKFIFSKIELPSLKIDDIKSLLSRSLPNIDSNALQQIKVHFDNISNGGELWIKQGINRIIFKKDNQIDKKFCPFCAQDLENSRLIDLYHVYFSESYSKLLSDIEIKIREINKNFGGDAISEFQEKIIKINDLHRFWIPLCDITELKINTEEIIKSWKEARKIILDALTVKKHSPLEFIELNKDEENKLKHYQYFTDSIEAINNELIYKNEKIKKLKEDTSSGNIIDVSNKLKKLKITKNRYSPDINSLCDDYIIEKNAKKLTENSKFETRKKLDKHRDTIFPKYQKSINYYLEKFNTSFRICNVTPTNPKGRPSCSYYLKINNKEIPLETEDSSRYSPSFKNTLSSGDRSTLALAFFFASLKNEQTTSDKIVVIDDPVTSLDDYREITTAKEIQALLENTEQMIILSHDKRFLCKIWKANVVEKANKTSLEIKRVSLNSSKLAKWDIHKDTMEDHDIRHKELVEYYENNIGEKSKIAQNIRFVIEKYCRVSWPEYCTSGFTLGQFKDKIRISQSNRKPILNPKDYREFTELIDYANKFHHETNPTWEDEIRNIKDNELLGFVKRTLNFIKRR